MFLTLEYIRISIIEPIKLFHILIYRIAIDVYFGFTYISFSYILLLSDNDIFSNHIKSMSQNTTV